MTVETTSDAPVVLSITTYSEGAWEPVYDLHLDQGTDDRLVLDRGALVSQNSGEDWLGVELTLSTASPSDQSDPSSVSGEPWRIFDEAELRRSAAVGSGDGAMAAAPAVVEAPVVVEDAASPMYQGATVLYRYPTPVDLRAGVDSLRLSLGSVALTPSVRAVAAPEHDDSAYLVASIANGGEVLLPGQAQLWLDGALVGLASLPLVAPNDGFDVGFGAIRGLRLTRTVTGRSQGDAGLLSMSTARDETVTILVENLTGRDWPVHLLDHVPYSEQDDLKIRHDSTPPPSVEDFDGKRGVLAWDFDLAQGTSQQVRLHFSATWPKGYVLP